MIGERRDVLLLVLYRREVPEQGMQEDGEAARMAYWAAAVLYNGLTRYDDAASAARQVVANAIGPWTSVWVLPELVEAAARLEHTATARDALERSCTIPATPGHYDPGTP